MTLALCLIVGYALSADCAPVVVRERDSADRSGILRWYTWGDTNAIGKSFVRCEGRLEYDIEIPVDGWYRLEQQGMPTEWNRTLYIDGKPELVRFTTMKTDIPEGADKHKVWHKECNLFIKKGRHVLAYERTGFPGCFPVRWRLVQSDDAPRDTARAEVVQDVIRTCDALEIKVTAGARSPITYPLVAVSMNKDLVVPLGSISFPATKVPLTKTFASRLPEEGIWRITLDVGGKPGWKSDLSANTVVTISTEAPPCGATLRKSLVVDIDCVKTSPYVERDGATRIVEAPFGKYRESSGAAPERTWGLDGFSYHYTLPDIDHAYILEVSYPDDAFRSIGFWSNDAGLAGVKARAHRDTGSLLTGGVETGGQYRNTNRMLKHEAVMYPTGTNVVLAIVNLNRGSTAAASRIRVWRIDGPLPAAPSGIRRGRLAGGFFEENGRWKRHFGMGSQPNPKPCESWENLRSMERWGEWNRYAGVNLMSPSVVAYGGVQYPSKVIDGSSVQQLNEMRMLALVAEKYGNVFVPHLTLHGDQSFDKRMGVTVKKKKATFRDPDVVEWSKDGSTVIPWRSFSYNCLHPAVQRYVYDVVDEIATMIGDTCSFGGVALRIPLSWQFSGMTGLNNGDYGYGDWTIREFSRDTGVKMPGEDGDPKRFRARYEFLMSHENRAGWIAWRTRRVKAFYRRLRDRLAATGKDRELYFMWWPSAHTPDELAECGLAPEAWSDEPGISFYGMQFLFGRRCFAPRSAMNKFHALFDKRNLRLSRAGRRAVGIYSDYYEPNDKNFQWSKFGGAPYTAFDALEPPGDYERQIYACSLAQIDAGVYFSGGNGWIFGTPSVTAPFMREFLALPPDRFEKIPGLPDDPVCFRELLTGKGRFVYAVNVIDAPVRVKLELKGGGRLLSAVDEMEAPASFTLPAYGMKSFLVPASGDASPASIAAARLEFDPAVKTRYAAIVSDLERLLPELEARHVGPELPRGIYAAVTNDITRASKALRENRFMTVTAATSDPKLLFALDLTGHYPEQLIVSSRGRIGGWPKASGARPRLVFKKVFGGVPDERSPADATIYSATDGTRTWAAFHAGGRLQLREFGPDGRYRRSGLLTNFGPKDFNQGDSRNGFQPTVRYPGAAPILYKDNRLYVSRRKENPLIYDPSDIFRQIPTDPFGSYPSIPAAKVGEALQWTSGYSNFNTPSRLKVRNGKILFMERSRILALDPASGGRVVVLDASKAIRGNNEILAFDYSPSGKLVVVTRHPANVPGARVVAAKGSTIQTDVLAEDDGSFIRRVDPWDKLRFARISPDGKSTPIWDFEYRDFRQGNDVGIFRAPDGKIYVAGGGSRRVAAFRPDGSTLWERKWEPAQSERFRNYPWRNPAACCLDGSGRLWVADADSDMLIALDAKTGDYLGDYGRSGTIDDKSTLAFSRPTGLAVIGDDLYVMDSGNLRILAFRIEK